MSFENQKFVIAVKMFNETTFEMKKQIEQQKYGFEYYTRYIEKSYVLRALYLQATIGDKKKKESGKNVTPSSTMSNPIDRESQLPSPSTLPSEQGIKQRRRSRVIRNFSKIKEFCNISEFEIWLNEQKMWSVGTKNELKDRIIQNYRCKFSRKSKTDCMKSIRLIKYHNENTYTLEESDNAHDHSIILMTKKDFPETSSYDNDKKLSPTDTLTIQNTSSLNQNNILVKILNGEDSPLPSSPINVQNSMKKSHDESIGITNDNSLPNYSCKNTSTATFIESQQKSYTFKDSSPQNVLFKLLKGDDNQISQKTSLISMSPSLSIRPQSAPVVVSSYRFVATFRDKPTFQQWFLPISNKWIKKSKDYESDKSIKYFVCTFNIINNTMNKKESSSDHVNFCPSTLRVTSYNLKEEILVEESIERHTHGEEIEYGRRTFEYEENEYMGTIKKNNNIKMIIDNRSSSEEPFELVKNKNETFYLSNHLIKRKRKIRRNKFKKLLNYSFSSIKDACEWISLNKPNYTSHIRKIFNSNEQIYYTCSMYGRRYTRCQKQYRIVHDFNKNSIYIEESRKNHNHGNDNDDFLYEDGESFMWRWIHGNGIWNEWCKLEKMKKIEAEELFIKKWNELKDMLPKYIEYWKLLNNPQISEEELKKRKIELSIVDMDDKMIENNDNYHDIEWIIEDDIQSSDEGENNV